MLLITNCLERWQIANMPSPCHGLEKSLSEKHIRGMAWGTAWYV
jgi:hypothetical protein